LDAARRRGATGLRRGQSHARLVRRLDAGGQPGAGEGGRLAGAAAQRLRRDLPAQAAAEGGLMADGAMHEPRLALGEDAYAPQPLEAAASETERMVEALLFAAAEPLSLVDLGRRLPEGADVPAALAALQARYDGRGVVLVEVAGRWRFQTAED